MAVKLKKLIFYIIYLGLSPYLETLNDIENIDRFREIPHEGPFTDLMWSDPDNENKGFSISPRLILFGTNYFYVYEVN